jgi:hypothetical protein
LYRRQKDTSPSLATQSTRTVYFHLGAS